VLELFPALHPSLGQAAARLSGGTRRQLAIAQALLAHPVVLLLDEPYAGLSTELARRLTQHLAIVAGQGTAVLLVTHDVAQARVVASATVRLAEGQLHPDRVPAAEPDD
jgi:ABC-type branched-subunit amino acid transport system ATPase component